MRLLVVALLALVAAPLQAGIVTYDFAGTFTEGDFLPIPAGTQFTGSFSIDTSVPGTPESNRQGYTDYLHSVICDISVPSISLTIDQSTFSQGFASIGNNGALSLSFAFCSIGGTGWSYTPTLPTGTGIDFYFAFPQGTLTDLAHVPFTVGLSARDAVIGFGAGQYTFPGGSYFAGDRLGVQTAVGMSVTIVPEPSTLVLAALGLIGVVAMRRRLQQTA
jgi:hypothetical protein